MLEKSHPLAQYSTSYYYSNKQTHKTHWKVVTQNDPGDLFPVRFELWFCSLIPSEYISAMNHFVILPIVFPTEQVACTSRTSAGTQLRTFFWADPNYHICYLEMPHCICQ